MTVAPLDEFRHAHEKSITRLFAQAKPERWEIGEEEFAQGLHRSAEHRFERTSPSAEEVERYLDSLFVEDLALAGACERGSQPAWVDFLARFRPSLYAAARRLTREETRATEIADSLYAELYGLEEKDGRRRSLFQFFHGRSSLRTWLHSVVARTFVNDYRDTRRGDALKQRLAGNPTPLRTAAAPDDPDRGRYLELLRQSLSQALAQLEPRDRLRLSYYHLHELTLAETGRLLGEHESTVSRKLERTRGALRKQIEERLCRTYNLSRDQVRACYEYALETWPYDLNPDLEAEG